MVAARLQRGITHRAPSQPRWRETAGMGVDSARPLAPVFYRAVFGPRIKQPVPSPNHTTARSAGHSRCLRDGEARMSRGIFITGTDTGVGKTHVTAALLTELRRRGVNAAAFKPIACGKGGRHDAEIYAAIMNHEQPLDVINPIYLRHPLAPSVAAKLERKRIDLRKILRTYRQLSADYSVVLVEGAGGLLVPIRENYFVADLAKALKLPLLIVARLGLGTINHTLLRSEEHTSELQS